MSGERVCRRCLLEESGRADVLSSIHEHIEKIPPRGKTEPAEYARRLAICGVCEHLADGTCLKCGCYPEFRAAFRTQKCPVGSWKQSMS